MYNHIPFLRFCLRHDAFPWRCWSRGGSWIRVMHRRKCKYDVVREDLETLVVFYHCVLLFTVVHRYKGTHCLVRRSRCNPKINSLSSKLGVKFESGAVWACGVWQPGKGRAGCACEAIYTQTMLIEKGVSLSVLRIGVCNQGSRCPIGWQRNWL